MHDVATALNKIGAELNDAYFERGEVIYSMLLALVAGEHHYQLGTPGLGKSQIIKDLCGAVTNARYFKKQVSKTTPAEKMLGPTDLKEYRENSNLRYKREGYATAVELLCIDEIGKMSAILGHEMLTLMNEREYEEVRDGASVHPAPLHTAFTASNEMITNESEDAAAMWDRLLVRVVAEDIKDPANFVRLLTERVAPPTTRVDFNELYKVTHGELPLIAFQPEALQGVAKLRADFAREHLHPSPRRWRQSVKVLQAAAFLNGRTQIEEQDLAVLRFTLWDTVEQIDKVTKLCVAAGNPFIERLLEIRGWAAEVDEGLNSRRDSTDGSALALYGKDANAKLSTCYRELADLRDSAGGREIPQFETVLNQVVAVNANLFIYCYESAESDALTAATGRMERVLGRSAA